MARHITFYAILPVKLCYKIYLYMYIFINNSIFARAYSKSYVSVVMIVSPVLDPEYLVDRCVNSSFWVEPLRPSKMCD